MEKQTGASAATIILIGIIIAFAYILIAFKEHTVWASVILGIAVVGLLYCLYKFPRFRHWSWHAIQVGWQRLSEMQEQEEQSQKVKPPRVPIPEKTMKFVYRRAENRCQICGDMENPQVHHIDRNRANPHPNNLILLCGKHHPKAENGDYRRRQIEAWRDKPAWKK